ncbi:metallophosphoesterase [Ectothiorhodospira lacustris]|uniref:metallophosphoesterase n=1 Tax=Ectothiorhodospira lacustris TaxID=2899127 RepID=UPI001EE7980B|nr:metallophosphoesterase [Ectothiorhodospira lacustris]MCG5500477.1 metallophosphoesterase [Ectothiorhodospira lacustris]MCG5510981.1 metallophosphoesterase [Ectothiorhodospira lacustris]MCG5522711.1 metallophosphoesterase [Ectothiorhodospira lacustris]
MSNAFLRLERNARGRDFVVGDLHGMFSALEQALENLEFNPNRDRIISVGDLIDRGPESHRALEFLAAPWFHAVQGNHEQLLLDAAKDKDLACSWLTLNGGEWWVSISRQQQEQFQQTLSQLPFAIEVDTEQGRVGIVHADIPPDMNWQIFSRRLKDEQKLRDYALWSRKRINRLLKGETIPAVAGIDLVIFGHTPIPEACHSGNIYYLDTGATYGHQSQDAKLSILQIHPQRTLTTLNTACKKDNGDDDRPGSD